MTGCSPCGSRVDKRRTLQRSFAEAVDLAMFFRRWLREFTEFMFSKGNALDLAIGVIVGTQFQQIVNSLTNDLIMPLLNPLVPKGDWKGLNIPYFGGEILLGKLIDVTINSLVVGWALFFIIKTIRRLESLGQHKTSDAESSD